MKISEDRLAHEQAVLIPNIQTGLSEYPHVLLQKTPEEFLELLRQMISLNGAGRSYADFYWGRLSEEERGRVTSSFPQSKKALWMDLTASMEIGVEDLYFSLEDDEFLLMLHYLTSEEILFSSFYFTRFPCTVWGNYNLSWPFIFRDLNAKSAYSDMWMQNGI